MLLANKCAKLGDDLKTLAVTRSSGDIRAALATRQGQLSAAVASIQPCYQSLEALRKKGISVELPSKRAAYVHAMLQNVLSAGDDIAKLATLNGEQRLIAELSIIHDDLSKSVKAAWREHTARHVVPVDTTVLLVLANIPELAAAVLQVRQIQNAIQQLRTLPTPQETDINMFHAEVVKLGTVWQNLGGDSLPEEVRQFIASAGTSGVGLHLYTEIVADWFKARGIESSFRVVLQK